jgi:nanoRNase/pAp phosphatase (c-di-AMP/oligoRNAs hydrolase)
MGRQKPINGPLIMENNYLERLEKVLRGYQQVMILPHNDPDPDALAAAAGLSFLLMEKYGIEAKIAYRGIIGRAENKALVKYLDFPMTRFRRRDICTEMLIALVDTQPGAGNNPLPAECTAAIVIDHHKWREQTDHSQYHDVRPEIGSTSTILTEYLQAAQLSLPRQLTTALFYGIKTDTRGLSRLPKPLEANTDAIDTIAYQSDVAAYFYLLSRIDVNALANIEQAQVPVDYFRSVDNAIHAARIYGGDFLIAYLGSLTYPDMCAEIADFFMRLAGIRWALCMGFFESDFILSVRSRSKELGSGDLVQEIVRGRGSAGGHGAMGAGQIPIDNRSPERLAEELEEEALHFVKGTDQLAAKRLI